METREKQKEPGENTNHLYFPKSKFGQVHN